jgi:hypothetical protein
MTTIRKLPYGPPKIAAESVPTCAVWQLGDYKRTKNGAR